MQSETHRFVLSLSLSLSAQMKWKLKLIKSANKRKCAAVLNKLIPLDFSYYRIELNVPTTVNKHTYYS